MVSGKIKLDIGKEAGLTGLRLKRFIFFITFRFPGEDDTKYISEWAHRFKDDPVPYMDEESKKIYFDFWEEVNKDGKTL